MRKLRCVHKFDLIDVKGAFIAGIAVGFIAGIAIILVFIHLTK